MSDAASETARDVLAAHAARKAERERSLCEALTAGPVDANGAREQLEQLLDRETLADLDERVLALVTGGSGPEREPNVLSAVAAAQDARRRAIVHALLGRRLVGQAVASGGLDGGARQTVERPETHEQTLARVLRDRSADVGARL